MIAALYVATGGAYFNRPDVEPWDITRDARLYDGPWPCVCHSPCGPWGNYWHWCGSGILGDDGGCFAAALASVRRWGGVLEHPARSQAWKWFGLPRPPARGWARGICGGWSCSVDQGHYGHRARKPTWLYAHGVELPELKWGPSSVSGVIDGGAAKRLRARARPISANSVVEVLSKKARAATPLPFAELLLSMARSVRRQAA